MTCLSGNPNFTEISIHYLSVILPVNGKPVMLDDTCYYLSFNDLSDAFFVWLLLNINDVKKFLSSIVFLDSKRPYTKEILMRIDILKLAETVSFNALSKIYRENLKEYMEYEFDEKDFLDFQISLRKTDFQPTFSIVP